MIYMIQQKTCIKDIPRERIMPFSYLVNPVNPV